MNLAAIKPFMNFVNFIGSHYIVSDLIRATTKPNSTAFKTTAKAITGAMISGMLADKVNEYTDKQIDALADFLVKSKDKEETTEEAKSE